MSLFGNENCNLFELNEDELDDVTRNLDGDSWDEILDDIIPVPGWLPVRSKNWKYIPLISFNAGGYEYGNLFIIWDVELANGVLCDGCCQGVLNAGVVQSLEPELVTTQAFEYIDGTWGGAWNLRDANIVEIGRDDLLLKDMVYAYFTIQKESGEWDKAYGTLSPEEWITKFYL